MNIIDLFSTLRQGKKLANPGFWANSAAATSALAGLAWAGVQVSGALGYALPLTQDQISVLAGAVVAIVGVVAPIVHVAANPAAGLPPVGGPLSPDEPRSSDEAGTLR